MIPDRLKKGDTIGIASPSWLATPECFKPITDSLTNDGYRVKVAKNAYSSGWTYIASDTARAEDINELIGDISVNMVFFGGGEGGEDILSMVDYEAALKNPKIYLSYSDGTSLLNSIWAKTGIVAYYGQTPGRYLDMSDYNRENFVSHIIENSPFHKKAGEWITLRGGVGKGTLIGGYLDNFTYLADNGLFELNRKYVIFVEDRQYFNAIERESALIGRLERSPIMRCCAGLLFGQYSDTPDPLLLNRLKLLAERLNIPVAYSDDFGHGANQAILPIGAFAALDTEKQTLAYDFEVRNV